MIDQAMAAYFTAAQLMKGLVHDAGHTVTGSLHDKKIYFVIISDCVFINEMF